MPGMGRPGLGRDYASFASSLTNSGNDRARTCSIDPAYFGVSVLSVIAGLQTGLTSSTMSASAFLASGGQEPSLSPSFSVSVPPESRAVGLRVYRA